MINLFTKITKVEVKNKSINEIIDEIHESFYTEVDKLLASAKIAGSLHTEHHALIDKCERLKALGFVNTKEVKEAEIEIARLNDIKIDNDKKQDLIEAINYFSFKYPHYKFITENSVKKICEKYGLVYGNINQYTGTVPDKNLDHIERFKINKEDECYEYYHLHTKFTMRESNNKFSYMIVDLQTHTMITTQMGEHSRFDGYTRTINEKCGLEIAAPLKDFNIDKHEIKHFKVSQKIEIPDPVVLKPVFFKNKKHYLIVTAWGQEASDGLVVNERMN